MDVTFVCSGEEAFKMEVGYFDTVQDVKEKLQSRRGWPAAALSLLHNGALLEDDVDGGGGGGSGIERHGVVEGSVIHVALLDGAQHQQQPQQNKRTEKRKRRGEAAPPPHETGELALLPCQAGRPRHRTRPGELAPPHAQG